jgi:hypothetical protein
MFPKLKGFSCPARGRYDRSSCDVPALKCVIDISRGMTERRNCFYISDIGISRVGKPAMCMVGPTDYRMAAIGYPIRPPLVKGNLTSGLSGSRTGYGFRRCDEFNLCRKQFRFIPRLVDRLGIHSKELPDL